MKGTAFVDRVSGNKKGPQFERGNTVGSQVDPGPGAKIQKWN